MIDNILVTGSNGQLGSELKKIATIKKHEKHLPKVNFFFTERSTLDITDEEAVKSFCAENQIGAIVNCAAYTAVDAAESDEENANKINHLAVKLIAKIAKKNNIKLIHISTDYVFDGMNYKPYTELDPPNPKNVYGKTKFAGEQALIKENPKNAIIIRVSWVYSSFGNNFVKTMLKLGREHSELRVVSDQIGSPTYARDLAVAILKIMPKINNSQPEVFHFSNEGVCSWYDFAISIFELSSIKCKALPVATSQYPTPAQRPLYSLLDKSSIKNKYNLTIPYWKKSLAQCLLEKSS